MKYNIGDIIELDGEKQFMVMNNCKINESEFFLVSNVNNAQEIVVMELQDKNMRVIKEEEEIEFVLDKMVEED